LSYARRHQTLNAVYSIGGGNRAILQVLKEKGLSPLPFVAHDLDTENVALLKAGEISLVIHHDLEHDLQHAFHAISARYGLVSAADNPPYSDVQVITPHNLPGSAKD
jgi:LacI family transcriptional regulator